MIAIGHPMRRVALGAGGMVLMLCARAIPAVGASGATGPPTITGTVRFNERVTCRPGVWDAPAVSVRFEWFNDGRALGQGRSLLLNDPSSVNTMLTCRATVTDARGTSASGESAPVRIGLGRATLRVTAAQMLPGSRVRLRGVIGPAAWVAGPARRYSIVRVFLPGRDGSLEEISRYVKARADGTFTVTTHRVAPGRRRVTINVSASGHGWDDVNVSRTVRFSQTGR